VALRRYGGLGPSRDRILYRVSRVALAIIVARDASISMPAPRPYALRCQQMLPLRRNTWRALARHAINKSQCPSGEREIGR